MSELAHDVLVRVAEFLRKLPPEQLAELAAGSAQLEVVSRPPAAAVRSSRELPTARPAATGAAGRPPASGAGRPLASGAGHPPAGAGHPPAGGWELPAARLPVREKTPAVELPRPIPEIGAALAEFTDRAAAASYLDSLKLSVAQLRSLAAGLGIAVPSKASKVQARDTVVQWTVGRRADAAILSRPRPR